MPFHFEPNFQALRAFQVGPLAPYIASLATLLSRQGYCRPSCWNKIRLTADLSRWMERRRLAPKQLDEQEAATFLNARWKRGLRRSGDRATMVLVLRHLRQSNVTPAACAPSPRNDIDLLIREYGEFLLQERGLVPASVGQYLPMARYFLAYRFRDGKVRLKNLRASDVLDFVLNNTANRGHHSAQLMASVLRSFLGFLLQQGRIAANLAAAVPTVAAPRLAGLPRFLEAAQVERILQCCDRRRKVGKRDYALLLLLARLGLRAGEVARLTLDDINWRAGELRIPGKGARVDRLPLPQDVGQALVTYLQKGRPTSSSRRVFIQSRAPHDGLAGPSSVGSVVRAALARAQVPSRHQGAHLLRHSLATTLLRNGASLAEIGQVLRHQLPQTTEIYAKVDLDALRTLAVPWIGNAL